MSFTITTNSWSIVWEHIQNPSTFLLDLDWRFDWTQLSFRYFITLKLLL